MPALQGCCCSRALGRRCAGPPRFLTAARCWPGGLQAAAALHALCVGLGAPARGLQAGGGRLAQGRSTDAPARGAAARGPGLCHRIPECNGNASGQQRPSIRPAACSGSPMQQPMRRRPGPASPAVVRAFSPGSQHKAPDSHGGPRVRHARGGVQPAARQQQQRPAGGLPPLLQGAGKQAPGAAAGSSPRGGPPLGGRLGSSSSSPRAAEDPHQAEELLGGPAGRLCGENSGGRQQHRRDHRRPRAAAHPVRRPGSAAAAGRVGRGGCPRQQRGERSRIGPARGRRRCAGTPWRRPPHSCRPCCSSLRQAAAACCCAACGSMYVDSVARFLACYNLPPTSLVRHAPSLPPLPRCACCSKKVYTVLRSPHVNKDSREQFEVGAGRQRAVRVQKSGGRASPACSLVPPASPQRQPPPPALREPCMACPRPLPCCCASLLPTLPCTACCRAAGLTCRRPLRPPAAQVRLHQRLIDVKDLSSQTIDRLMTLDLPAGVDVEVRRPLPPWPAPAACLPSAVPEGQVWGCSRGHGGEGSLHATRSVFPIQRLEPALTPLLPPMPPPAAGQALSCCVMVPAWGIAASAARP